MSDIVMDPERIESASKEVVAVLGKMDGLTALEGTLAIFLAGERMMGVLTQGGLPEKVADLVRQNMRAVADGRTDLVRQSLEADDGSPDTEEQGK
jgi:hypothetical protein